MSAYQAQLAHVVDFSYLSIYSSLLVASVVTYAVATTTYIYGTMRASRKINAQLVESILGSTLR